MLVFGCMLHWYASMMFTVPTAVVGGWGWWSSRRINKQGGGDTLAGADGSERNDAPLAGK